MHFGITAAQQSEVQIVNFYQKLKASYLYKQYLKLQTPFTKCAIMFPGQIWLYVYFFGCKS